MSADLRVDRDSKEIADTTPDDGPSGHGTPAGDTWAAVVLVIMAIGIWFESTRWPAAVGFAGDPLILPRALALLMVCAAAALIVGARSRATPHSAKRTGSVRFVLLAIAVTAGLGVLLETFGLLLAAALYLFAMQRITAAPMRRAALVAIAIPAVLWLAFVKVLNVPLPIGSLWTFLQ